MAASNPHDVNRLYAEEAVKKFITSKLPTLMKHASKSAAGRKKLFEAHIFVPPLYQDPACGYDISDARLIELAEEVCRKRYGVAYAFSLTRLNVGQNLHVKG